MKKISTLKKGISLLAAVFTLLLLAGCGKKDYGTDFTTEPITDNGYIIEKLDVQVPGITGEYKILLVADLHIICKNNEINDEDLATVEGRIKAFSPDGGRTTALNMWKDMPEMLDDCNADIILFAGDMIDFCSEENVSALKEGLSSLETPYCYIRSDHDNCPYYLKNPNDETCYSSQNDICVNFDVWYVDLGEVIILCYNRSDKAMTEQGLEVAQEAIALGKPMILLTHVPFDSIVDSSLDEMNREAFNGRNITWGPGYTTDYSAMDTPSGDEFLKIIYSSECPITEVVAGHLHFSWDGQVTENLHQHIFDAAFNRRIGYIEITGTN